MNVLKKSLLASAVALASATSIAETSMTAGMVSDYVYRGSELGDAGAYFSVDYTTGGFYAGVWTISDSNAADSLEYDIYAGYDTEIAGVSVGLGYTAYEYTGTSDSEEEFTLSLGLGALSLSYSDGEDLNATDYDYDVLSVSADVGGFTLTYGEYDQDSDGSVPEIVDYEWSEISTGTEVGAVSLGLTLGSKSSGEDYLVLDMSTAIDL